MMCDPVREHRFRSCHTVYSVYFVHAGLCEGFVEPLLFANLAWRALSWCRRTSVRPPDDIEKSVTLRLHCAMPLSGNFAIQAKSLLQSSVNLHFLFGAIFFNGGFAISYPERIIWKTARANYPKNAGGQQSLVTAAAREI